jgi:hypothetical protein
MIGMEIQWTDRDPATGARRIVRAKRFAREWRFEVRPKRREDWAAAPAVTKGMWEELLDALERRLPRRDASEADVADVRKQLAEWREPPVV